MRKMNVYVISGIIMLFLCITCFYFPVTAEDTQRVVRVGYVDINNFITVDSEGRASGYGAEYLNKIAEYTGWKYEYKKGLWSECLEWLKEGKIDLLMPAEYSKERASDYLFSDVECCLDYAALVGRKTDEQYYYEDYKAFDGMNVGMIKGNYLNVLFEEYAIEHDFSFEPIYFDNGASLSSALRGKKVDAVVSGNMEHSSNQKLLAKIDYMPAYFITTISNSSLMKELNEALHQIFLYNPYYAADLHSKHYGSVERQPIGFTRQESEYIQQNGEITVLLKKDNVPMEWYDEKTKTYKGIYADILKLIENESGLSFRFVTDDSGNNVWETVKDKGINVWGSAYAFDGGHPMDGFVYTRSYYENSYSFIGKKENNLNLSEDLTIGVIDDDISIINIIKKDYPHWNIVAHNSTADCLKSIVKSETDLAIINSWSLSADENLLNNELTVIDGNALNIPICLGVAQEDNLILISILNKAILKIDDNALQECVFNSILSFKENISFSYLIKKYPAYIICLVAILFIFILTGVFIIYRNYIQKKQNVILQMKNIELKESISIQEHLRKEAQTDALTGLKNKSTVEYACQNYLDMHPNQNHAILVMDLDNFKKINDTYGHLCGDAVLKQFGTVLLESSHNGDVVGRIGGDEFLMFITCAKDQSEIEQRINMIYQNMDKKPAELSMVSISCSIGIVLSQSPHKSFNELFLDADQALYQAKNSGKNRYVICNG